MDRKGNPLQGATEKRGRIMLTEKLVKKIRRDIRRKNASIFNHEILNLDLMSRLKFCFRVIFKK